jgi:hypothetical protein
LRCTKRWVIVALKQQQLRAQRAHYLQGLTESGKARCLRLKEVAQALRRLVVEIPLFGVLASTRKRAN